MPNRSTLRDCCSYAVRRVIYALLLINITSSIIAQDSVSAKKDSPCVQIDLPDLIREWKNKPPKPPSLSTGSLLLVPVISSNPANGFLLGVAGQYAFKAKGEKSLYS